MIDILKTDDYVVLDTETTGVDSNSEIVSIAIINSRGQTLLHTRVKPFEPIPLGATNIHGITNEDVINAPRLPYLEILNIINGKHVVVYNADYDSAMLYRSMKAGNFPFIDWNRIAMWHCAMKEFARIYGDWDYRRKAYAWKKLSKAAEYYNIPIVDAHDALADCLLTLEVCKAMIGNRPIQEVSQGKIPF